MSQSSPSTGWPHSMDWLVHSKNHFLGGKGKGGEPNPSSDHFFAFTNFCHFDGFVYTEMILIFVFICFILEEMFLFYLLTFLLLSYIILFNLVFYFILFSFICFGNFFIYLCRFNFTKNSRD